MSPYSGDFLSLGPSKRSRVRLADDTIIPVMGEGTVVVRTSSQHVRLTRVLYVPDLGARLLSVAGIYDRGGRVVWRQDSVDIYSSTSSTPVLTCSRIGSGWFLNGSFVPSTSLPVPLDPCQSCVADAARASAPGTVVPADWQLWHARLGHVGLSGLSALRTHGLVRGMTMIGHIPKSHSCVSCLRGKMTQLPFPPVQKSVTTPFALVGMDLLGKIAHRSIRSGARYMLLLKDAYSGFCWSYYLQKKKHAAARIRAFFAMIELQYKVKIRAFRSDRGGEFLSADFVLWLDQLGVRHQLTVAYTPQQNGMVERANRTLCGRARTMLQGAGLPERFWEHALRYATWCTNRTPSRRLRPPATPYAALHATSPDVSDARVFGCLAHVFVPGQLRRKFDSHADLGVFLGIAEDTKAWEFWIPATGAFRVSRTAFFHETKFLRDSASVDPVVTIRVPEPAVLETLFPAQQSLSSDPARAAQRLAVPLWTLPVPAAREPQQDSADPAVQVSHQPLSQDGLTHHVSLSTDVSLPPPDRSPAEGEWLGPDGPTQVPADAGLGHHLVPGLVLEDTVPEPGVPLEPSCAPGDPPLSPEEIITPDVPGPRDSVSADLHISSDASGSAPPSHASERSEVVQLPADAPPPPLPSSRPVRIRQRPLHFSPQPRGKTHQIYRRAGTASAFLVSQPPERWNVPKGLASANKSDEAERWLEARLAELAGLQNLDCWELVDAPPNVNILRSHWVFALKLNPDNTIERFKARLVVDGSQQRDGIDFDETFASTAGRTTVRVFIALAAVRGWFLHQLDVSQAFLYGKVDKTIYMFQPRGHSDGTRRVCKLRRSLYGLKQAPRIWGEHLRGTLLGLGFTQSPMDPSLYSIVRDGVPLWIVDWVDDMLLGSPSEQLLDWFKGELQKAYKVKDLGVAQKYIGLELHREPDSVWLHQAHYCFELLEKFGSTSKSFPVTPLPDGFLTFRPWETLSPDGDLEAPPGVTPEPPLADAERRLYQQIVGSLNYAAHSTRLDIAYAVSQLSRATQKPRARHLAAAKRCVQYLAGTAHWGLCYGKNDGLYLETYVDAGLGPSGDSCNTSGLLLQLAGAPVSWLAKKQDRKTTSTCDSESLAVMTACQHVLHMRDLLAEFDAVQRFPTPLYNDNSACVRLCHEPRAHHKSLQLTRQMAYVRQLAHDGFVHPLHVNTDRMPADFLTKGLAREAFLRCRSQSGMAPLPSHVTFISPEPAQGGVLHS